MNSAGQAIGIYSEASGQTNYYLYEGGKFLLIRLPYEITSSGGATITGINNAGDISGYYLDKAYRTNAFLLTQGHLKTLTVPGAVATWAYGLNNVGQVVGYSSPGPYQASGFVWSESTGFQTVDDPNGNGITIIYGINDKGVIIGSYGQCFTCNAFIGTP